MTTRRPPTPSSASPFEAREIAEAAREAAAIGGRVRHQGMDPAQWPLSEAGEGVAEGFELAELDLIDATQHTDDRRRPIADAPTPEIGDQPTTVYGEADHEHSSETSRSDR